MRDARLRQLSVVGLLLALLTFPFGIYVLLTTPAAVPASQRPSLLDAGLIFGSLEFLAVGFLVARRQPRNVIGWLLLAVGVLLPLSNVSSYYSADAQYAPGAFPAPGFVSNVAVVLGQPILGLLITAFLVFPDGRLRSRRWLPFVALGIVSNVMATLAAIVDPRVLNGSTITSAGPLASTLEALGWIGLLLTGVAGVVSMFLRYRRGSTEVKHQLRWIFVGVFASVAGLWIATALNAFAIPLLTLAIVLPATIGFAVLKYRLYDIDLVISRAVVYGALAIIIAAVYVGLVVGIGSIVGRGTGANLILSLVATAIVALAFQPARARLQRAANRLVYGKQATPYEVLSEFSHRVAETYASEELLPRMARVLGEGTGAERAAVWLKIEDELRRVAEWPDGRSSLPQSVAVAGQTLPSLDAGRTVAVRHGEELLGALTISKRAGEALTPIEEKLLNDLATQAGLVLKNAGLNQELLLRLQELRASRQRLVTAQDEERRRLERNLHDGAQQQLVALKIRLGLVEALTVKDPLRAQATLAELKADTDEALDNLRDLARGIYPPLLADRGLAEALHAQARKATVPVHVDADGVARYSQEVEAAVYFCCLEALQNVQKYARATNVTVRLREEDGRLHLEVQDDGTGFDPGLARKGTGLQNMQDRLDALGGTLVVRSSVGKGTSLRADLPIGTPATSYS
jgi:signal transduction histidine kinase